MLCSPTLTVTLNAPAQSGLMFMKTDSPTGHDASDNPSPFAERVRAVRDSWADIESVRTLSQDHSRAAQSALLGLLCEWFDEAVAEMCEVLHDEPAIVLTPIVADMIHPEFVIWIGDAHRMRLSLCERERPKDQWYVDVRFRFPTTPSWVSVAPDRKHGSWTREGIRELLLSLLSAYKRFRLGGDNRTPARR